MAIAIRRCYMCDEHETSVEHAPPKCLFPERKDVPDGTDYRKNLITVRSCEAHNSLKSQDDEYLLQALAGSYTSSQVGLTQFITKVKRAFDRTPSKASSFIKRSEPILLRRSDSDEWEQGAEVIIEGDRLDHVLGNCARALYFHETKVRFVGHVSVSTAFTMYNHPEIQARVNGGFETARAYFASKGPRGENPAIFWYKFQELDDTAFFLMCFDAASEVLIRLDKRLHAPVDFLPSK
jgi:hypothetical protein